MELANFNKEEIFNLDLNLNEIQNWMNLLGLNDGLNAATFEPSKESILKNFIENYPPENHRLVYYNAFSVITFSLLFTNRKEILKSNIELGDFKTLLLDKKKYYYEFLNAHFKKSFFDAMQEDHSIELFITLTMEQFEKNKRQEWLKIKNEYNFNELQNELSNNLDIKLSSKLKI